FVDNSWFPPDQLFPITSPRSASDAIQVIVRQGEGTPTSPLDAQGEVAHYYRFEQIVKGRLLVQDRTEPTGFAFRGAVVALDDRAVWNM
ncbi:ferritin-like domain-containing protein, partial [Acinetobacter baumannii]